jgi:DNA-binding response OmpR family regulator
MASSKDPGRVLIADDEPQIGSLLREVLTRRGFAVETCRDGEAALEKFREGGVSLLILDVVMPHKTGIEVIRELRGEGETVPVLLMSSFLTDEVLESCRGIEHLAFLQKPFSLSELGATVERLLRAVRC